MCLLNLPATNVSGATGSQESHEYNRENALDINTLGGIRAQAVPVLEELYASLESRLFSTTTDISPTLEPDCQLEEARRYERL